MITADNLSKRFEDGTVAVERADFSVDRGQVLGLLGPNGVGKTTTVHMLLGHLPPTDGKALVNGVNVLSEPLEARRHVAYVSENVLLYGTLTAEQNLRFFCEISGKDVTPERQRELIELVGLAHAADRPVETFSKGMRQRLGIAIALAKDPPALVMDEPTTGLDPVGARELNDIIGGLRVEDKAVLLVTHDLFRLQEIADHVIIMHHGLATDPIPAGDVDDIEALYREAMGLVSVPGGGVDGA